MKILIVDVQGFQISDTTFSPKELAVYDGKASSHYVFRAPFHFYTLPSHLQQQANWLMNNHHCINWNEGFTPVFLFPKILQRIFRDADLVYVKGREKAKFIRSYTNKHVIEIEEQPALSPSRPSCMHHSKSPSYCALSNVYSLYKLYVME